MKYWVDTVASHNYASPRAIACQRFWAIALAKGALRVWEILPWRVSTTETLRSRFRTWPAAHPREDDRLAGFIETTDDAEPLAGCRVDNMNSVVYFV